MRLLLYVIIVLNIISLMSFNDAKAGTLPLKDRVWILSKTYQAVSLYFAHWGSASYGPEKADSVFQVFISKAIQAEDRSAFTHLTREYMALLQNSHTSYTDFEEYRIALPLGFEWMYFDDEWVVVESRILGLRVGDVVDSIDGVTVESLYQKLKPSVCASSESARRGSFKGWALSTYLSESFTMTLRDHRGDSKTVLINRNSLDERVDSNMTTGSWIKNPDVAYIKIPSFAKQEHAEDAVNMVDKYKDASSLIIDVRGNPGGNAPSMLTAALMDQPYRRFSESTPISIALFRYYAESSGPWWGKFRDSHMMWGSSFTSPDNTLFRGKLIILIDRKTGSAAEDFVVSFKDNKRALIIGENSFGSSGQPYSYQFGDIGSISIGTKRVYLPDGSPFEGVGITPDITIIPTRNNLYEDYDPVLGRAMEEAGM
ncbi:MAG: hypothetical protein KAR42_10390 [candidate division Zixibacteria bacterium]|nr:hypothetical protein [candidate division Zixibacteria bacterium]